MAEAKEKSIFETLYPIDVSENTEKKNNLSYLSWAWAWAEVKKRYPKANYKVIKNEQGWIYHTDGRTCWVEVSVTIDDLTHEEILPVMDFRNNSISLDKVTSFDVNKAIQRAVTKCIGRFGLGLYIYAGEDLPEDISEDAAEKKQEEAKQEDKKTSSKKSTSKKQPIQELPDDYCTICHLPVMAYDAKDKDGNLVAHYPKNVILEKSIATFGSPICMKCWMKKKAVEKMKQAKIDAKLDGAIQELQHEDAGDRV